jgi:hypothetical protein
MYFMPHGVSKEQGARSKEGIYIYCSSEYRQCDEFEFEFDSTL